MMAFKRKYLLSFLLTVLIASATMLSAQEPVPVNRSVNKVILEGKVYYIHLVKPGQTLYSIAKAYNVTEKEILIENPGSSANLQIGQALKIPLESASAMQVNTMALNADSSVHVLKKGETLYSLSRRYKCSVEDLLNLNPGLDINHIPEGSRIKIPTKEMPQNTLSFDEEGFISHVVKKGETLYSIGRYYKVSVRELRAVNPSVGWGGPKTGDVLKIPQPETSVSEIFTGEAENSYVDSLTLPGQLTSDSVLLEIDSSLFEYEYTYDDLDNVERGRRKRYSIAYLIPFDYSEMVPLDTLLKDVKSPLRRERIREDYMLESARPKSVNFMEFLEGSLLAIDSLTDSGIELEVSVFDTKKSMYRTRQILEKPEMAKMDLIIGPFYAYNLELVSDFSKEHKIPLITPFHSNDSLLRGNPYLFQANPSFSTEYKHNADYIGRLYDRNLILVHNGDSAKAEDISEYKNLLFEELKKYSALEMVQFKEVIISDGNTENLMHALNPDKKNLIILPATDEAFASQVASKLFYEVNNYDIEVFGSSYWLGFDDIEITYIHALHLIISHTHWYDYTDPHFLRFLKKYRENYQREPESYTRKGSNFGINGYDLSLYFISALKDYGPRFIRHISDFEQPATITDLSFERVSRSGGYENRNLNYYYFDTDLNVKEIQLPAAPPAQYYFEPAGDDPLFYNFPVEKKDSTDLIDP